MTFDDELRRTFEELTNRLRTDIEQQIQQASTALVTAAQAERERAVAEATASERETAELKAAELAAEQELNHQAAAARLASEIAAAEVRGREEVEARLHLAIDEAHARGREMAEAAVTAERSVTRSAELAISQRLVDAVRAISDSQSLTDILDALVNCASREAARVGILLVRDGELRGWRFAGFGPTFEQAATVVLPLHDGGVLADAVRTGAVASAEAIGVEGLPHFAELPEGRAAFAAPIVMGGQVTAVLYADQGAAEDNFRALPLTWMNAVETMACHAARCLEAVTALKAARALTERPGAVAPSPLASSHARDERDGHAENEDDAARRYARLLVSEIKLYHEPAVISGRRERDLSLRLSSEIARARSMYEQRVPIHLRQKTDHFYAELVRTLANGDATLLGQMT